MDSALPIVYALGVKEGKEKKKKGKGKKEIIV
jgi:hypothetical protein